MKPALALLVKLAVERCGEEKVRALEDAIARADAQPDIEARCSKAQLVAWLRLLGTKIPKLEPAADALAAGDEKRAVALVEEALRGTSGRVEELLGDTLYELQKGGFGASLSNAFDAMGAGDEGQAFADFYRDGFDLGRVETYEAHLEELGIGEAEIRAAVASALDRAVS